MYPLMQDVQVVDELHRKHPLLRSSREQALAGHRDCASPLILIDVLLYLALMVSMSKQLLSRFLREVTARVMATTIISELCAHTESY